MNSPNTSATSSANISAENLVPPAEEKEFTSEQIKTISNAESKINAQIYDLVEMKASSMTATRMLNPLQSSRKSEFVFDELEAAVDIMTVDSKKKCESLEVGSVAETISNLSFISNDFLEISKEIKALQKSKYSLNISPRQTTLFQRTK